MTIDLPGIRPQCSVSFMKPVHNLAETHAPDGARFSLHEQNGEYSMKLDGTQLMSSGWTESELLLADEACRFREKPKSPRLLIGGLGLGFTLKRVLELVAADAEVVVAELLPEVVAWNRDLLGELNGKLLDDRRVKVFTGDVCDCILQGGPQYFNAMMLDVDNGPTSLVQPGNGRLYDPKGLATIYASLRPGGRVSYWAADLEVAFPRQLRRAGFAQVEELEARAHPRAKRAQHRIYTGERRVAKTKAKKTKRR